MPLTGVPPRSTARRRVLGLALLVVFVYAALQAVGLWQARGLGERAAASAQPGDIAMISSETCLYCAEARAWFERHRVPFAECTIERDAACAARYAALLAPGTPVIVVRGRRLLGFDARAVTEALAS